MRSRTPNKNTQAPEVKNKIEKALRVGIIQHGKLIEERWFRKATPITIGSGANNTFQIDGAELPHRFPLFNPSKEGLSLQVPEGLRGKLLAEGRHLSLLQIEAYGREIGQLTYREQRSSPGIQRTVYEIPLREDMRGRLEFGTTTLLFQYATPPPPPTPSPIPTLLVGGWHKGVDWAYASIIMLSFVAHSVGVYWLQQLGPLPPNASISMINLGKNIKQPMLLVSPPSPPTKVDKAKADKDKADKDKADKAKADKAKADKRALERKRRKRPRTGQTNTAARKATKSNEPIGILKLLVSKGRHGTVNDLMANHHSDKMLKALSQIRGVDTAVKHGYKHSRRRLVKTNRMVLHESNLDDRMENGGPTIGETTRRKASDLTKVASKFKLHMEKPVIEGSLSRTSVMDVITRNYARIKYCYERVIKTNGALRGKISMEVKINTKGRAFELNVTEDQIKSKALRGCLRNQIKTLRFPRPKDGVVTVELPFVFTQSE